MSYIETARLDLREICESDTESIYNNWCTDPEVTKYMTWDVHKDVEETKEIVNMWLKDDKDRYVIVLRETNEIIGMIDVVKIIDGVPDIGYVLGSKWWNNGYMSEACEAFIESLFAKGYKKLRIEAAVENIASNRVIEKNGFNLVETKDMELKGETTKVNFYTKEDPTPTEEVSSKLTKDDVGPFRADILKKMIKTPIIVASIAGILAVALVVLGFTAFSGQSFSPVFIIAGFVSLVVFVFYGALIIYMCNYVKKIIDSYFAHAGEDGNVDVRVLKRKDYFKVFLGKDECIIEFKKSEVKSAYIKNSIIMINTIFGAVFLPNNEELRQLVGIKE